MSPKISVIIPIYNAEKYLEECLQSISNQSFDDFEILAINDGSIDNSLEILNQYQEKEKRLKIFSQENKGVSAARNLGLENAIGEYIAFVDADDFLIDVNWFHHLIQNANFTNADIVCAGFTAYSVCEMYSKIQIPFPVKVYEKREIVEKILPFFFQKDTFNAIFTKLYSRKLINENGISFPQDLKIAEDTFFNLRSFSVANIVSVIDSYGYSYREALGSATRNVLKNDYLASAIRIYKFDPTELTNNQINTDQAESLKKERFINSVLSLMYIYINPANKLSFLSRWKKVNQILNDENVTRIFKNYEMKSKNKFEKYSFDAIKKKQTFKLFLYNYYSYLRNKN